MTLTLLLMFGLKQPALGLSLPQHRLWAGCRFASLSMLARRSRRRGPAAVPRPPRVLQRSDSGVPEIAACHPEQYDKLLSSKVASMVQLVTGAVAAGSSSASEPQTTELPASEVFQSARTTFGMRSSHQIWREGAGLHYVMFNRGDSRTPHEVPRPSAQHRPSAHCLGSVPRSLAPRLDPEGLCTASSQPAVCRQVRTYPMGSPRLSELMGPLIEGLAARAELCPAGTTTSSVREGWCASTRRARSCATS